MSVKPGVCSGSPSGGLSPPAPRRLRPRNSRIDWAVPREREGHALAKFLNINLMLDHLAAKSASQRGAVICLSLRLPVPGPGPPLFRACRHDCYSGLHRRCFTQKTNTKVSRCCSNLCSKGSLSTKGSCVPWGSQELVLAFNIFWPFRYRSGSALCRPAPFVSRNDRAAGTAETRTLSDKNIVGNLLGLVPDAL